ncbi:transmembrane protein PMIS2 [Cavia porcellus]|uniref:transmembrane protein PMIS2 n=1 Tax=Cavia porcellus TaxID=10141 RepID=UPI002FE1E6DE
MSAEADERKPDSSKQSPQEKALRAPPHTFLTIVAIILFPPLGLAGFYYNRQTIKANQNKDWDEAHRNSARTGWLDVFAILIGLGLIYVFALFL